jgi:hypothetical protein
MHVEAWMPGQPCGDLKVSMGSVVVENKVNIKLFGGLPIYGAQEFQKLLVTMPWQALADYSPIKSVECSEQSGGAIAFVVMGHRSRSPRLHWQARLSAVESLNLTLFVHAQYEGVFRGIEVKPYYVLKLLHKARVSTQLECTNPVGLQSIGLPDPLHAGWAQGYHLRQAPRAPVRGAGRLLMQRPLYYLSHLVFPYLPLAPRSTPVLEQTGQPISLIPIAPATDRRSARAQSPHNLPRRHAIGTEQYDARPESYFLRRTPIPYHSAQIYPIRFGYRYSSAGSHDQQYTITNDIREALH